VFKAEKMKIVRALIAFFLPAIFLLAEPGLAGEPVFVDVFGHQLPSLQPPKPPLADLYPALYRKFTPPKGLQAAAANRFPVDLEPAINAGNEA
jgi:hypothetical protein